MLGINEENALTIPVPSTSPILQSFAYVLPRVDQDNFQAEIPEYTGPCDVAEIVESYNEDDQSSDVQWHDFRLFAQNIMGSGQRSTLATEDIYLEYFLRNGCNSEKAIFNVVCELGRGKDAVHTERVVSCVDKFPSGLVFSVCKDTILASSENSISGSYFDSCHQNSVPALILQHAGGHIASPNVGSTANKSASLMHAIRSNRAPMASVISSIDGKNSIRSQPVSISDNLQSRPSREKSISERADLRRRWVDIRARCVTLSDQMATGERPKIQDAQLILDDALALPGFFALTESFTLASINPLELSSSLSSSFTSDDLADALRLSLGELLKVVAMARRWSAEVRDELFNCNLNAILQEKSRISLTSMDRLRKLLSYGEESLRLTTPEEEQLRQTLLALTDVLCRFKSVVPFIIRCTENNTEWHLKTTTRLCSADCGVSGGMRRCQMASHALFFDEHAMQRYHYSPCQLDVLLTGGGGISAFDVPQNIDPAVGKPTFSDVVAILKDAASLPIKINEMVWLGWVCHAAETFQHDISSFLSLAQHITYAKAKSVLERRRPSLSSVEALFTAAEALPFQFPSTCHILRHLEAGRQWQKEVLALKDNNAVAANTKFGGSRSKHAQNPSPAVPLKRLDALISVGERLPFDFTEEMSLLIGKKQLAKVWLEKLRKSFVPTKMTSSRLRKAGDDSSAAGLDISIEKPSLESMKLMVMEGEQLYRDDDGAVEETTELRAGGGGVVAGGGGGGGGGHHRDLDRAAGLVEEADSWIERVRDLLCPSKDGGSDDAKEAAAVSGMVENADFEERLQPAATSISATALRSLIDDVDTMPVAIDEAEVLRNYLRVLQWCEKVRPYLLCAAMPISSIVVAISDMSGADKATDNAVAMAETEDRRSKRPRTTKSQFKGDQQKPTTPTLTDIQKLSLEVLGIRQAIKQQACDEMFSQLMKPLPEERLCSELVASGESWFEKYKKVILNGNMLRKGTKLHKIKSLFLEGKGIALNFDEHLVVLRRYILEYEQWIVDNISLLRTIGALSEADAQTIVATVPDTNYFVPDSVLVCDLQKAASSLLLVTVDGDTMRTVKNRWEEIKVWINHVHHVCTMAMENVSSPAELRRELQELISYTSFEILQKDLTNASITNDLPTLDTLILRAKDFQVSVEPEIKILNLVMEHARKWDLEAAHFVESIFLTHMGVIDEAITAIAGNWLDFDSNPFQLRCFPLMLPSHSSNKHTGSSKQTLFLLVYELANKTRAVRNSGSHLLGINSDVHIALEFYDRALIFILNSMILLFADDASFCHQKELTELSDLNLLRCAGKILWADIDSNLIEKLLDQCKDLVNLCLYSTVADTITTDSAAVVTETNYFRRDSVLFSMSETFSSVGDDDVSILIHEENNSCNNIIGGDNTREHQPQIPPLPQSASSNTAGRKKNTLAVLGTDNAVDESSNIPQQHQPSQQQLPQRQTKTRLASGVVKPKRPVDDIDDDVRSSRKRKVAQEATDGTHEGLLLAASDGSDVPPAAAYKRQQEVILEAPPVATKSCCVDEDFLVYMRSIANMINSSPPPTADIGPVRCLQPSVLQIFARVLETFRRILLVYSKRLSTVHIWKLKARALISFMKACEAIVSEDTKQAQKMFCRLRASGGEIMQLLRDADIQFIISSERIVLELFISRSREWELQCSNILGLLTVVDENNNEERLSSSSNKKWGDMVVVPSLTVDQKKVPYAKLDSFLSQGTRIFLEDIQTVKNAGSILALLRTEYRNATVLANEIQRLDALRGGGAASEELLLLVQRAEALRIDMTEFTDPIVQLTKSYCVCRQHYHGEMIGCDICDEWYHFDCVGLSELQALRAEKYICIRCLSKQAFTKAMNMIAHSTRKWHNASPDSAMMQADRKRQQAAIIKIQKRVARDKSELDALLNASFPQQQQQQQQQLLLSDQVAADNSVDVTDAIIVADQQQHSSSSINESEAKVAIELKNLRTSILRAEEEEASLRHDMDLESNNFVEITQWFDRVRDILKDPESSMIFSANSFEIAVVDESTFFEEGDPNRQRWQNIENSLLNLLSPSYKALEVLATEKNIIGVVDVRVVLDAVRWANWCCLLLRLLRSPPSVSMLQKFLSAAKRLLPSFVDDRITKVISAIVNRSRSWKIKYARFLNAAFSKKYVDMEKFTSLLTEGNTLPIVSRCKTHLSRAFDYLVKQQTEGVVEVTASKGEHNLPTDPNMKKRGPKPKEKNAIGIMLARYCCETFVEVSSDAEDDDLEHVRDHWVDRGGDMYVSHTGQQWKYSVLQPSAFAADDDQCLLREVGKLLMQH